MPTALVTGANRGLGLEYARQLAAAGWRVLACARRADAPELAAVVAAAAGRVEALALDVTDAAAVDALAARLRGTPIDLLLNNAGTTGPSGTPGATAYQRLDRMDYGIWRDILEVNLLGAFRVATAFRGHVAASGRRLIVNLSSDLGSVANNRTGQMHAYRSSKAALNMITKGMAVEWPDVVVVAMAPGWCRTDLGGPAAQVDPADSVRAQLELFDRLGPADSGRYLDRFGHEVAW
jgi:NAD(P)-dependent dehydrogenase (short-subunit alcohol dehydrogenase family)